MPTGHAFFDVILTRSTGSFLHEGVRLAVTPDQVSEFLAGYHIWLVRLDEEASPEAVYETLLRTLYPAVETCCSSVPVRLMWDRAVERFIPYAAQAV